jgi:hypothetical protein
VCAGLIGLEHGLFELQQGAVPNESLLIQAIAVPCQPEAVWHACLPAMTILPDMRATGIATLLAAASLLFWSAAFIQRRYGGLVAVGLSLLLLLTGGGFVPVFIGLLAGVCATRMQIPLRPRDRPLPRLLRALANSWPWLLGLLAAWLPLSWIFGFFFGPLMLELSVLFFLLFDLSLPLLIVFSAYFRDHQRLLQANTQILATVNG